MSRDCNQQKLGDIIHEMISEFGLEENILSVQAGELFEEMMGRYVKPYINEFYIKNKILYARISSDALKNELSYGKSKIKQHINEGLGKDYLTDIKFL